MKTGVSLLAGLVLSLIAASNSFGYYNAQTGRWLSRDPVESVTPPNPYAMCRNDSVQNFDVLGLYGKNGHFYTPYILAMIAGHGYEALDMAIWTQFPDSDKDIDAIASATFGPQNWKQIETILHSLHGGDPQKRRSLLLCILKRNPDMPIWQRGLINHAMGDAFAHTMQAYSYPAYSGKSPFPPKYITVPEQAYSYPLGHFFDGTFPDKIATHPDKFKSYLDAEFSLYNVTDPAAIAQFNEFRAFVDSLGRRGHTEEGDLRNYIQDHWGPAALADLDHALEWLDQAYAGIAELPQSTIKDFLDDLQAAIENNDCCHPFRNQH